MKNKFRYLKSATMLLSLAVLAGCFTGCKDDEEHYTPFRDEIKGSYAIFKGTNTSESLEVDTKGMIGDTFSNTMTYEFYTTYNDWYIQFDTSSCFLPSEEWIHSWPGEGSGDGRFTISFDSNTVEGETRHANINIVTKKGHKIIKTIKVAQAGSTSVRLNLVASFQSILNMEANDTAERTIAINANVFWDKEVQYADEYTLPWVHIVEGDNNPYALRFNIDENFSTEPRTATIVIYQVSNPDNTTTITINQKGVATGEGETVVGD